ncbi:MAG: hypothetical protein JNM19_15115 [Chitinophagaceae bacterium]|nr:hypothetical protein [Chitinophagaceae bacterium]
MKQVNNKSSRSFTPRLRVITPDNTPANNEMVHLVNTAWLFACAALWNHLQFSAKETANAKQKIEALLSKEDKEKAFLNFCQRVLLARQYVTKTPGRYIPLPSVWLDDNNKLGFTGTENWYNKINSVRQSLPAYKEEIRAMAEAILELSKEPSSKNYQYWRSYFIDHRSPGLLNLFQLAAVQQLYN